MVYKWYILPIGGLYATYQLFRGTRTIDLGPKADFQGAMLLVLGSGLFAMQCECFLPDLGGCFFVFFFAQSLDHPQTKDSAKNYRTIFILRDSGLKLNIINMNHCKLQKPGNLVTSLGW